MSESSRTSRMKALGALFCTARRLTWDSGVWGTLVMMPATRGRSLGSASIDHDVARIGTFFQRHFPQQTVPFPPVEGDEIDIG